jgi:hypothetical protein
MQSPPAHTLQTRSLLKRVGAAAHGFFFFAPGISRLTWPLLSHFFRNRPFLTTLDRVMHLDGDVIECGVFWGRSLIPIARRLKAFRKSEKCVFALDSFDGFRNESISSSDVGLNRTLKKVQGRFKQNSSIVSRLRRLSDRMKLNVKVVPGYFEDTLPSILEDRSFCFVHLDCDIYSSYQTCLPLLYPRLVAGGIMLFDEYRSSVWPGATQAIDEFFSDKPEKPQIAHDASRPNSPKYFVMKQA